MARGDANRSEACMDSGHPRGARRFEGGGSELVAVVMADLDGAVRVRSVRNRAAARRRGGRRISCGVGLEERADVSDRGHGSAPKPMRYRLYSARVQLVPSGMVLACVGAARAPPWPALLAPRLPGRATSS